MTDWNGFYYMRTRFYNPEIKRFVNQDVLLGDIVNGQTLNRFAYVTGNPIGYVDPEGKFGILGGVVTAVIGIGLWVAGQILEQTFFPPNIQEDSGAVIPTSLPDIVSGLVVTARTLVRGSCKIALRGVTRSNPVVDFSKAPIRQAFWADPSKIRFSQRTISENNYAILMQQGKWNWRLSEPLVLLRRKTGEVVSIDNRRLTAAKISGERAIPVKIYNSNDLFLDYKTWRTVEEAFLSRAKDPRTIVAGGEIPSTGLDTLPRVVLKNP